MYRVGNALVCLLSYNKYTLFDFFNSSRIYVVHWGSHFVFIFSASVCVPVCVCIWTETKWSKIILSLCCNCEINLHNNLFALLCTLCPPLLLSSPSHPHMEVERPVACNTSSIATCTVHKKPATARQIMRQVRSCGSKSWGI